jgi:uncharacterized protein YggE
MNDTHPTPRRAALRRTLAKALAVAVLVPALPMLWPAASHAEDLPRLVSVGGQGEVRALPDMAYVTIGVESRKPTLAEARSQVTATVERVLALTRELKIDPKHVDSSGLQVQPEYRWNDKDSQRVLLGYVVSRQVEVELRNLEQLGTLLERSVSAGANQVGNPRLDSSRRAELEREALSRAVADARLDAETLATAAGVRLGPVFSLSSSGGPPPRPMMAERMLSAAPMADSAAETYTTGELTFQASVSAQWRLE